MNNIPEPTPEQIEGARKILKRRNIGLSLMLLIIPFGATLSQVTGSNQITLIVIILYMITMAGYLFSASFATCPRCKKMFFMKWYLANGFASKCVHCGLKGKE